MKLLSDEGLQIVWTTMWRNSYGRLFKAVSSSANEALLAASPDSANIPTGALQLGTESTPESVSHLVFKFVPDIGGLVTPSPASVPVGSDGWAILNGHVSVTPLRASFAEPLIGPEGDGERTWKIKL